MTIEENARLLRRALLGASTMQEEDGRTGRIDRDTGAVIANPKVDGQPGRIWVRLGATQSNPVGRGEVPVWNMNKARTDRADIPVVIDYDRKGDRYIKDADNQAAATSYGDVAEAMYHNTPQPPEFANLTSAEKIIDLRVRPDEDLGTFNLIISAGYVGRGYVDVARLDISSEQGSIGSSARCWIRIGIDLETLTGVAVKGTDNALLTANLTSIDLGAGVEPLAGVLLTDSSTAVTNSDIYHTPILRSSRGQVGALWEPSAATLTLSSGVVTASAQQSYFILAAESSTTDDLDTVTMSGKARFIILQADSGDTITIKHGTGNIALNGSADFAMSGDQTLLLWWNGVDTLSDMGAGGGYYQTVKDNGTPLTQRSAINFQAGSNVTLTISDDSGNDETDITIAASGSGGNVTSTDTYTNLAGSPGSNGDVGFPTDAFQLFRSNGSALVAWGPLFPFTSPSFSGSWVNQGSATLTSEKDTLLFATPGNGSGNALRLYVKSAPSTPYTITAIFIPLFLPLASLAPLGCGLAFRQSSDGKIAALEFEYNNSAAITSAYQSIRSRKWTDTATVSADYLAFAHFALFGGAVFLRIADDGSNRICSLSTDGQNWRAFHTVTRTDFLTADQIGFFLRADGNATNYTAMRVLSYVEG